MNRKNFFIFLIFFVSCFKAERSPFDTSTPTGVVINVVIQTLSQQRLNVDMKPPMEEVEQVSKPSFNLTPGYYATAQFISLSTSTSGAVIYFTTDGQTPTTSSMVYSEPIHIWKLAGKKIQAIAVKEGMLDSEVLAGVFSYPPLKTGVTQCPDYIDSYWIWTSCSTNDRQDGEVQKGVARSYTDNGDGTVMDNSTGLIWQKCAKGITSLDCSGSAEVQDWTVADNYCKSLSLAGKVWRLPTITELQTLVDFSRSNPHINPTYFPNAPSSASPFYTFWSSTNLSVDSTKKFTVASSNGDVNPFPQTNSHYVRCVSGEHPREYVENFTDNGDGTITDHTTKLVWQKCSLGQTNDSSCTGTASQLDWSHAVNNCVSLNLAGKVWRLPNMNELFSLWNTSANSALNSTFFPNSTDRYWSSTSYTNGSGGWDIGFTSFNASPVGKGVNFYGRCVSDL